MDVAASTAAAGGGHGDHLEESYEPPHHFRRHLVLRQVLWRRCMGDPGADGTVGSMWSHYGHQLQCCGVVPFTRHQARMNGLSMVMYNNLLSLPLLVLVAVLNGEIFTVFKEQSLRDPRFQAAVCMSVTCGFLISFCSLWFLSSTTATTYSLVGSLNKLPLAIVGLIFFDHVWNTENIVSILVGLIAGIVFARAKQAQPSRSTTYFSRH
mmetsp:Transcript_20692/g.62363  ORF Transcript_20692/g.62363 Transcript_20692/m.62363 type:complete len:209 (-) Transcript_20692:358-984(-)